MIMTNKKCNKAIKDCQNDDTTLSVNDESENWFIYLPFLRLCQSLKRGKWQRIVNCDSSSWEADSRTQHRQPVISRHVFFPIRQVSSVGCGGDIYFLLFMVALLSVWVSRMSLDVTDVSLLSAPFIWLHHRPDNCNLRLSNWLLSSEAE